MAPWAAGLAGLSLLTIAPLLVWAERRVKAWSQLRRGPGILQPYRDLRRLFAKQPLMPAGASPFYAVAPVLALATMLAAATLLPVWGPGAGFGGALGLLALGLLLALHRLILVAQAYDTGTAFGGLGASRELFLGGLAEPAMLVVAAGVFLATGDAGVPGAPLAWSAPATWLLAGALAMLFLAESARIPFDNPATHLELTMVHEAMLLESSGWMLAFHELAAALKQAVLGAVLVAVVVPLPAAAPLRVLAFAVLVIALSAVMAVAEASLAKVRLFRASHLLIMAAFLALLAGVVGLLQGAVVAAATGGPP